MTTICKKNLETLKDKNQKLYDAIVKSLAGYSCEAFCVEKAKNGEDILCLKKNEKSIYFNSKYNPTNEAKRKMEEYSRVCDEAYLAMFGMSTGVFARCFLNNNNYSSAIIVYEPCAELFLYVIQHIDISDILQNPRFFIAVKGLNEYYFSSFLTSYTNNKNDKNNRYMALDIYKNTFCTEYEEFNKIICDTLEYHNIQKNTIFCHGKEMVNSLLHNMKYMVGSRSAADYIGVFPQDIPAIVVSAGPSLQKNVECLKEAKGKAVIIVVDAAINAVMSRGIKPDFVITVDPNKELKNFTAEGLSDVFMLADTIANSKVLDMVEPENLVFYSTDSEYIKELYKEEGTNIDEIFAGGSVALSAMAVALYWGFKRIIMIGQDLAMTENKQYADGGDVSNNSYNCPTLYVKDIYGNDVLTKRDYYDYIQNIENLAYRHPEVEFIDATEGGAYKKNTKIMTLKDALYKYTDNVYDIEGIIRNVPRRFNYDKNKFIQDNIEKIKKEIITISDKFDTCINLCSEALEMLNKRIVDKERLHYVNTIISGADGYYDSSLCHSFVSKYAAIASYEFESTINQELDDPVQDTIRLYSNSKRLYEGIIDAIQELNNELDELCKQEDDMGFKVGIIIPCYNAEEYVNKCIEGLRRQTIGFENIQIIMINDGSLDGTYDKLLAIEKKYPDNVMIINFDKNMGPSYARNIAVGYVVTDYFAFLDVDDWVEDDMYEYMYNIAVNGAYDFVTCESDRPSCEDEANCDKCYEDISYVIDSAVARKRLFKDLRMSKGPCDKIISKSFWMENNIFFPEGYFYEDTFMSGMLCTFAKKVYRSGRILYHWWRNPNGTTSTNKRVLDRFVVQKMFIDKVRADGIYDELKDEFDYYFFENSFVECMWTYFKAGKLTLRTIEYMKRKLLDVVPDIVNNPYYLQKRPIYYMMDHSLFHCFIEKEVNENTLKEFGADIREEKNTVDFWGYLSQIRKRIYNIMESSEIGDECLRKELNEITQIYKSVYEEYALKIRGIINANTIQKKCNDILEDTSCLVDKLNEFQDLFTRKAIKSNYLLQTQNQPYVITNLNSIQYYYNIISVLKLNSVLDIGGFLKRIGAVGRITFFSKIEDGVRLDMYEKEKTMSFPIYKKIYNSIYNGFPDNKYEMIIMLHIQNMWDEEERRIICEYVVKHSERVTFGIDDYFCKDFFKDKGVMQYIDVGNSTFIMVTIKGDV